MIRLQTVRAEDRELLWNILQKYLYELTQYYPDEMDEHGNYPYGYFDACFTDPERKALFIYHDETLVGFALIHPYSAIGHQPDYTMAEFSIFPPYRRKHYAVDAAHSIFATYPGKWEIKYHEKNTGAKKLWTGLAAPYFSMTYHINEAETVLEFRNDIHPTLSPSENTRNM